MSDHLPECPSGQRKWQRAEAPMYGALCICRELRSCEQRAGKEAADRVMSMRYRVDAGWQEMKEARAYAKGVQAAREAVVERSMTSLGPAMPGSEWVHTASVLAAIDALLNNSSDNGTKVQDSE